MKDLGVLKYFLGIKVAWNPDGIYLCQLKYILDIVAESGNLVSEHVSFPMEQNHQVAHTTSPPLEM